MASPVEKYELILAADPRSRVFVELARALIERGDHERAARVCEEGLVYHPDSVQARVLLGRALLSLKRREEAVGPLTEALELAPNDARIKLLLDQTRTTQPIPVSPKPASLPGDVADEAEPVDVSELTPTDAPPGEEARAGAAAPASRRVETPIPVSIDEILQGQLDDLAEHHPFDPTGSIPLDEPLLDRPPPPAAPAADAPNRPEAKRRTTLPSMPAFPKGSPPAGGASPAAAAGAKEPARRTTASMPAFKAKAKPPADPALEAPAEGGEPGSPPRLPRASPPPPPAAPPADAQGGALAHLPPEETQRERESKRTEPTQPGLPLVSEEAARIAAKYESDLRKKMHRGEEGGRGLRPLFIALGILAVALVSAGVYALVRRSNRASDARAAVVAARAGLARDTLGALRQAWKALDQARSLDPLLAEATVLEAEVTALLWTDFADEKGLERARALATSPAAGTGALAARYLTAPGVAEREQAAAAILATPPSDPLLRVLAGAVLRGRGDTEKARQQLEAAARAQPPMLRALADLGDMTRAAGDIEEALRLYRLALQAHPTHPRSVLGAAEIRVELGRGLEESLQEVEAMARDPQSTPPGADRLRADLTHARLLFALGRQDDAVMDLGAAAKRFPGRPEVPAALADLEMARGGFDRAEAAAEKAFSIAPRDPALKELLARARLGRGRLRELLQETEGTASRPIRLLRAQARCDLGEYDRARAELEATRRDGRMPAEAAGWMAYVEAITGHRAQALVIIQALESSKVQAFPAIAARGRLLLAEGKTVDAEKAMRAAVAVPGAPPQAQVELAVALRALHRAAEAKELLTAALARNPYHAPSRLERARARIDLGDGTGAAEDARRVLEDRPGDPEAQRLLASAQGAKAKPRKRGR